MCQAIEFDVICTAASGEKYSVQSPTRGTLVKTRNPESILQHLILQDHGGVGWGGTGTRGGVERGQTGKLKLALYLVSQRAGPQGPDLANHGLIVTYRSNKKATLFLPPPSPPPHGSPLTCCRGRLVNRLSSCQPSAAGCCLFSHNL